MVVDEKKGLQLTCQINISGGKRLHRIFNSNVEGLSNAHLDSRRQVGVVVKLCRCVMNNFAAIKQQQNLIKVRRRTAYY